MKPPIFTYWFAMVLVASLICGGSLPVQSEVVINEIHYRPDKNEAKEFVELHNSGKETVDLSGWKFSSGLKFTFQQGTILKPDGFLVLARDTNAFQNAFNFAPAGQFGGKLGRRGDKLLLQDAEGRVRDEVAYKLGFPWPIVGDPNGDSIELIGPSLDNSLGANWRPSASGGAGRSGHQPTPGARNSVRNTNSPPQLLEVGHLPREPRSGQTVRVTVKALDTEGVASVVLEYQAVAPGKYVEWSDRAFASGWVALPMKGLGAAGAKSGQIYEVEMPPAVQQHRWLVRYRIKATDTAGLTVTVPYPEDPQRNFAYFVYDGVPSWKGAVQPGSGDPRLGRVVEFGTNVMRTLPVYHLLAKKQAVEQAQWREQYRGKEYKWTGTLVYDGVVYDHIRFRARGGSWRYAMGKNMWKFAFNRGHEFQASDHYGRKYDEPWSKLNLGACIQQGDYGQRGEQGMFEAVGFRLFNLVGVEAPLTHWVQLRVIDEADEARSQSQGDFWGLYLAIEQMDGHFLDEHNLPDGNLYKMEFGTGELNNRGAGQPADKSDLNAFLRSYQRNPPDEWWRKNLDLDRYYSYRAIVECIHHYDIDEGAGKNYFYYRNPETSRWSVLPWDIDLTWTDSMYGGGQSPFFRRVLPRPAFRIEYQNRLREIRDLLFNTDQAGQLLDEYAAVISDSKGAPAMVQADRALWDYNPIMSQSGRGFGGKSAPGQFYQASSTGDFPGMVRLMKNYVNRRGRWIDSRLLNDASIPATPSITYAGSKEFPSAQLRFRSAAFSGPAEFAAIQWRLGEVTDTNSVSFRLREPRKYEINAVWASPEISRPELEIAIPPGIAKPGHVYRARVRMKDTTGRWGHWSPPVEFSPAR